MTRDELLQICFDDSATRPGQKILEMTEGADVLSHLDLSYRRILVRPPTSAGPGISDASLLLYVAAIGNVCTDPEHRGKGYASALLRAAHNEAATHLNVDFAALFALDVRLFERLGYFHPEGAQTDLLVCRLGEDDWPAGRVDTRGEW